MIHRPPILVAQRAIVALIFAVAAIAKGGTFREFLEPPVSKADYAKVSRILDLNKDQQGAADLLFEGYMAAYKPEADRLWKLHEQLAEAAKLKSPNEGSLRLAFTASIESFWRKKDFAQRQLLGDIKAILTPEQVEGVWISVERLMRRKYLNRIYPRSASTWNLVDVTSCLEDAIISGESRAVVQGQVDEYEESVDRFLKRYEATYWTGVSAWRNPNDDDLARIGGELGPPVAALNKKFTQWIADLLPQAERERFLLKARPIAYPALVLVDSAKVGHTQLQQRLRLIELSVDIRIEVDARLDKAESDLSELRASVVREYDLADASISTMSKEEWQDCVSTPEANPSHLIPAFARRRCDEVSTSLLEGVRRLLTDEQKALLPSPPASQQPASKPVETR